MVVFITGCSRPNPNPELTDLIYLDIQKELQIAEGAVVEIQKKLEEANKKFELSEPRTLDRTIALDEANKAKIAMKFAEQDVEFLKIRLERRKVEGRAAYRRAFAKGETWPDPKEFEHYLINKRLLNAPKTWSKRLEAIQNRSIASQE